MSKVAVKGNASGTGVFTIESPNSNTDRTLTLPDAAGTVLLSGNPVTGTTADFSSTIKGGSTIGVGGATPAASGAGITFPATQSASTDANTLDDYEEGTFTPVVQGTTTDGTATYSVQVGQYTKIGNRVLFNLRINYSSGTGTGNLRVGGLPFTSNSSSSLIAVSHYIENVTLSANNIPVASVIQNTTTINIDQIPTGGGAGTGVPYDSSAIIILAGQYLI